MDQDKLTPELEKLLKQVKLKEPPQDLMTDYMTGVNVKINKQLERPRFEFPQVMMILVVGAVFAGLSYFIFARVLGPQETPALQIPQSVAADWLPDVRWLAACACLLRRPRPGRPAIRHQMVG